MTRVFEDLSSGAEVRREDFRTHYAPEAVIHCIPAADAEAGQLGTLLGGALPRESGLEERAVRQAARRLHQLHHLFEGNVLVLLRLQRARQLLRDTNHSIVQVGLMCGFSSGSHFSTAFGALFGNTPREERQRKLGQ